MAVVNKSELIKLYKTLKSDGAIGKKFGVTRQAIHQLRQKYSIDSKYTKNPVRNAQILALYGKGLSGTSIAKKLELSISQTYRIINKTAKKKSAKKKK
jgi:DNA invertase Pin-like site-specific DNA recombinase